MIPAQMMTAKVTLNCVTPGPCDKYNRPTGDVVHSRDVSAYYRPRRTGVTVDGADIIDARMQVILQPDVDLTDLRSVVVEGQEYFLDGQPQPHWHPVNKKIMYTVLVLRRSTTEV